jgi:hypothetical protein
MSVAARQRKDLPAATQPTIRIGVPLPGGRLVRAVRERGYPALFSANAFARQYPLGHDRAGEFRSFRFPDAELFDGVDAALDSSGFVAASRYGDYRWSISDYFDLVASRPWAWYAAMDYCVEPAIASDRPLRLLRIAATAQLLGRCRSEARRRQLPAPLPVLQGWTRDEYALCAEWLPLDEWPALIGVGSMCRRHALGPDGVVAIVEALDALLPSHCRLHLFGVKSSALALVAHHPRVASTDSMAWDVQARAERRTGRTADFRALHMERWLTKQRDIVASSSRDRPATQGLLFDPFPFGGFTSDEDLVLEALALQYAQLLLDNDLEYRDAVWEARRDGATAIGMLRSGCGLDTGSIDDFDELIAGLSERILQLRSQQC